MEKVLKKSMVSLTLIKSGVLKLEAKHKIKTRGLQKIKMKGGVKICDNLTHLLLLLSKCFSIQQTDFDYLIR